MSEKYVPRLKTKYIKEIKSSLQKEFNYESVMAIPYIQKIVLNMGVGDAVNNKSIVDHAVDELTIIAGQKAVKTYARKSISNFKLREGMPIGAKVTLRGDRLYDFLDRLISIALPRVRDFRGLTASFDGKGNYSFGIREQIVFPEINYDKIQKVRGLEVTFTTTANTDAEALSLLKGFGLPLAK